jgi:hypothetical protein
MVVVGMASGASERPGIGLLCKPLDYYCDRPFSNPNYTENPPVPVPDLPGSRGARLDLSIIAITSDHLRANSRPYASIAQSMSSYDVRTKAAPKIEDCSNSSDDIERSPNLLTTALCGNTPCCARLAVSECLT